eukprot:m.48854 g.48854  ORF g.48854 m.48854 type:complete len:468 (+) comp33929_c0_seq3:53-1456(+)
MEIQSLRVCRRMVTVEVILFVYQFAEFMSIPLLQQLVYSKVSELKNYTATSQTNSFNCNVTSSIQKQVEEETSYWILYLNVANSIPAVLSALALGAWSDKTGRRFVLSLPAVGLSLNAFVVLSVWYRDLPIPYLLIGQIAAGALGGFATFLMACFAYVSDISDLEHRTVRISILESMTYVGGSLGNVIGGIWVKSGDFAPAFWCISASGIFIVLYVILYLIETRPLQIPAAKFRSLFCSCGSLITSVGLFRRGGRPYYPLIIGVSVFALLSINFSGMLDVIVVFVFDSPLCWASDMLGYFFAFKLALYGVAAMVVLPLLKWYKVKDFSLIYTGLISGAAGLILLGFSRYTWMMMYLVPVVSMMRGVVVPCLRSLMSQMVGKDNQGALFSGVGCVEAVCGLLATLIYNGLYPATRALATPHGFCFFLMAGIVVLSVFIILVLQSTWSKVENEPIPQQTLLVNNEDGSE